MVIDGSSVITTPGTQTQYSLTVTSQDYDITVRADTCGGSLTGDTSSLYNINLTGEKYCKYYRGNSQFCSSYHEV